MTRKISDTEVTRDATSDSPAYLIKQDDGDRVLNSHSEVQKASLSVDSRLSWAVLDAEVAR